MILYSNQEGNIYSVSFHRTFSYDSHGGHGNPMINWPIPRTVVKSTLLSTLLIIFYSFAVVGFQDLCPN